MQDKSTKAPTRTTHSCHQVIGLVNVQVFATFVIFINMQLMLINYLELLYYNKETEHKISF